jgi:hypothetical protein
MTLLNINQEQRNLIINDQNASNKRPLVKFINKAINSSTNQHHKLRPISNKCMLRYSYQEPTISTLTQRNTTANNNVDSTNYSTNSLHNHNHRSTNHYFNYHRQPPMAMTNTFYFCPNKTNSTSNSFIEDNRDNENNDNNGVLSETELNFCKNFKNISINTSNLNGHVTRGEFNGNKSNCSLINETVNASNNRANYARNGQSQENEKFRFEANNNNRSAFQAIVRTNVGGGGKNLSTSEGGCLYL